MTTGATYLGGQSVGSVMPSSLAALAAAEAAIGLPIVDTEAKLVGAASASASVTVQPPSLELAAAIEGSLQVPGVAVDVTAMTSLAGELNVELGVLKAALALVVAVKLGMGAAGVHAWALDDRLGSMGGDISGVLAGGLPGGPGPESRGVGILLVASDGGAIAALQALFALSGG